jgi:predicted nucleic acid-binding protein
VITFVDTNVMLDVFLPDPDWGKKSQNALEKAYHEGSLIINEIIYAELTPQFNTKALLDSTLDKIGIRIVLMDKETAWKAGIAWKKYRKSGGKRDRVLADFFIGAHAQTQADRLLTRDRGFYKAYFKSVKLLY